jgi:hypothetical protein
MSDSNSSRPFERREKFAIKIRCPTCSQIGSATWEENAEMSERGPNAVLLGVSSGFYLRVQKKNWSKSEVACAVCESTVPND